MKRHERSLKPWRESRSRAAEAAAELRRWTKQGDDLMQAHLVDHPLSKRDRQRVRKLYLEGKGLCCDSGLQLLKEIIDDCWAEYINNRAYEVLGCDSCWKPGGRYFEDGRKKLEEILEGKL